MTPVAGRRKRSVAVNSPRQHDGMSTSDPSVVKKTLRVHIVAVHVCTSFVLVVGNYATSLSTKQCCRLQTRARRELSRSISTHIRTLAIAISPAQDPNVCQLAIALAVKGPRFDMSIYGAFLKDIPRRIGSSSVRDAAASALVVTLPLVASRASACKHIKSCSRRAVPRCQCPSNTVVR